MDDFVRKKLTDWNFCNWIERFEEEGIDRESLECLGDKEIDDLFPKLGPRAKFKKRLKLLKGEQSTTYQETEDFSSHDQPSTSDTSDKGKRKSDLQDECSKWQTSARKRQCTLVPGSYAEDIKLSGMRDIMKCVYKRLDFQDNTKLQAFLKNKISDLETEEREMVGVFGRSGAGKSSLINAVIGEKDLLPNGNISACTTVMIKVEATPNLKYEAEIEFITKEEWKDEMWPLYNIVRDNEDQEEEDGKNDHEINEKRSALYGEECKNISFENLLDNKCFREIPEFLRGKPKFLKSETAKELSAQIVKYTRRDPEDGQYEGVKQWYWPLVKCVTVKVPRNPFLQHVTLVDLPGNGDFDKSRDEMWKGLVRRCSTVWIVTEINRAATEKESWEILESASSFMGNGGECQQIHFICTKSDHFEESDNHSSAAAINALILKRNMQAKKQVRNNFNKNTKIKKHFNEECFKVFTVSSTEFWKEKHLEPHDTEIPELREFLQNLNDCHSETLNYVSRAHGILSLIQGARSTDVAENKRALNSYIQQKISCELEKVKESMEETYSAFEKCLTEGVEKSKTLCEAKLKKFLYPNKSKRYGFYGTLKSTVEKLGTHKQKTGKQINLNMKLSSFLTDSINEEFRKTFPNGGKHGPFNGVISMFSLDTEKLIQQYNDVELQLTFLNTEEEKIKAKLNKIIRERKKDMYKRLMETIEKTMQEGYKSTKE
ncbi:nuclear GTPase SLIP-GC-like isoform X2 [Channa argus]|uniref:nuclear GTPase SLIP-GC-like isoform X2 n=1 Tax=Channa argus TaxID=215402 RepID=UPI0035217903